jgi:hypothetical protein
MTDTTQLASTTPATPAVLAAFSFKDLLNAPAVIKAAVSMLAAMPNEGLFLAAEAQALEGLLPHQVSPTTPLHVIAVGSASGVDLKALALKSPTCMNVATVNLLQNHTFVSFGPDEGCCAVLPAQYDWHEGPVLRLFLTQTTGILVGDELGDAFFDDMNSCAGGAGRNYNPYNIWSDAELAAAAQSAELNGVDGNLYVFPDNQTCLGVYEFVSSCSATKNIDPPANFPVARYLHDVARATGRPTVRYCPDDDTYVQDDGVCLTFARAKVCEQVAQAIAAKCKIHRFTLHKKQSHAEILWQHFYFALCLRSLSRAEACWVIYRVGELLAWPVPAPVLEELNQYNN